MTATPRDRHRVVVVGGGFGGQSGSPSASRRNPRAFSFLTHGRGARLITGEGLLPPIVEPEPPVIENHEADDDADSGADADADADLARGASATS